MFWQIKNRHFYCKRLYILQWSVLSNRFNLDDHGSLTLEERSPWSIHRRSNVIIVLVRYCFRPFVIFFTINHNCVDSCILLLQSDKSMDCTPFMYIMKMCLLTKWWLMNYNIDCECDNELKTNNGLASDEFPSSSTTYSSNWNTIQYRYFDMDMNVGLLINLS